MLALGEQSDGDGSCSASPSAAAADPFSSFLSHNSVEATHARTKTLQSSLGFTASLAMKKMAASAKILNALKKSPLLNPAGVAPRSRPAVIGPEPAAPSSSSSSSSSAIPDSFVPHLQALAHHPHVAVLSYPASSVITHQGSPASLVSCVISGRVRHVRDGAVCAEMGRGGMIGADSAVFSSEGYRRWRRGQWRRRQQRKLKGEAEGGWQHLHGDEEARALQEQRERNMAEDEAELGFQQEEERGRRRRRQRCVSFTSVQSIDGVECVVFPSSLLLSFLQSDRALQSHAYSQLTALHWLRRSQWRQAELRLQRLWGDGSLMPEEAAATEATAGSAAVERKVLGSAGFVYWDALQAAANVDDARLRRLVHEQNRDLDHPFFAFSRGEGGGPVERHRVRLRVQGGRDGDRDAKREMRKEREKEEKVKKVRRIIDAMDRKRRQKEREEAEARLQGGDDDPLLLLDDDGDEDEYETEDEDDAGDDNPTITDARYVQAMSLMRRAPTPKGGTRSQLATPKLRMDRRLLDRRLDAATLQAKEEGRREQEKQAERMEVRLLPMTPRHAQAAEQAQGGGDKRAGPQLDRSFLPVTAAGAAPSHRADAKALFAQWSKTGSTEQPAQSGRTAASSGRQQQQHHSLSEQQPEEAKAQLDEQPPVSAGHRRQTPEEVLAAGLARVDYERTKQRLREEERHVAGVETEAVSLVDRLRVDARGAVPLKVEAGVARSAIACKTGVKEKLDRAQERWGREQGQVQRILAWSAQAAEGKSQSGPSLSAVEERAEEDEGPAEEATVLHETRRSLHCVSSKASPLAVGCFSFPYPPSASSRSTSRPFTAPTASRAAQPHRPTTPSPPSTARQSSLPPRPSTAQPASSRAGVRSALLSREARGREAAAQSEQSMVDAAGNRGLGWQLRLDLMVEADAVRQREEELQRQQETAEDRQRIADVLRLKTRTRRVALTLNASTAALPASATATLKQQQPQRAAHPVVRMRTPARMAEYAGRMAAAAISAT